MDPVRKHTVYVVRCVPSVVRVKLLRQEYSNWHDLLSSGVFVREIPLKLLGTAMPARIDRLAVLMLESLSFGHMLGFFRSSDHQIALVCNGISINH